MTFDCIGHVDVFSRYDGDIGKQAVQFLTDVRPLDERPTYFVLLGTRAFAVESYPCRDGAFSIDYLAPGFAESTFPAF
jgi:hypothetical protein